MEVVLGIIGFIWSVLGVILFFKIWGMCNDVSDIKQILIEKEEMEVERVKPKEHKIANPPKTTKKENKSVEEKQDFMMAFNNDCLSLFKQCKSKEEFEIQVDEIIAKYNKTGGFDYSTLKDGLWEQFKQL